MSTTTSGPALEMARHSTSSQLIAADKVQGTAVYDTSGERLGAIETFMLDKVSGRAAYSVLSYGGFLGIGSRRYPLPWAMLKYDRTHGGYVIDLDRSVLEAAPYYDDDASVKWDDPAWGDKLHDYYQAKPSWI